MKVTLDNLWENDYSLIQEMGSIYAVICIIVLVDDHSNESNTKVSYC